MPQNMKKYIASIWMASLHRHVVGFECSSGFLDQTVEITSQAMNDNYCDCPLTGEDETLTNACSGSNLWTGIHDGINDSSHYRDSFACMRQPTLVLPRSRLNDGICDCCDGSDEKEGDCPDICEEVLRKEREERERLRYMYQEGSAKRNADLKHYQSILESTMREINELESDLPQLQSRIQSLNQIIQEEKSSLFLRRFHQIDQSLEQVEFATIQLNVQEMMEVIISTCILHGEMMDLANPIDTCSPFIDAGMDIGILWKTVDVKGDRNKNHEKNQISVQTGALDNPSLRIDIVNVLMARKMPNDMVASSKDHNHHHRNHDSRDYDIDHMDYYNDDFDDHEEEHEDIPPPEYESVEEDNGDEREKYYDEFVSKYSVIMRSPFYNQAKKIVSRIKEMLDIEENHENEDGSDVDHDNSYEPSNRDGEIPENKVASFDPMAIQMVKNILSRRISLIEHGNILARSALEHLQKLEKVLSSNEYASTLKKLYIGTMLRSSISAMDAVEIITIAKASIDPQVCYSPYFTLCDSETVVPITDEGFKRDLEDRCRDRSVRFCELNDDDGSSSIPSNIPDGYYNYYVPKSRESNDYLSKISESFYSYNFADMNISSVEKDLVTVQTEVDNINKRIQESKSKVGYGDDSTDFGPDGELFALHDQCLEMSSGKYTYHLCMFQKAKQTESGRGGGVDLGKWDGMSFYQETGQRVMKWKGGSKCWNGPMRSATVFVTCGIETKLVSAEEPNICEYEFRLESPIACDDTFRDTHDL
jgi:protein kinase C substrate 80K-H